ncbi:MAG TPA: hypothetical protein VHP30_02120 [Ignavibacteriales bacterium]|nr:hypothetical protein [Ignavibacteriales bacterium]
MKKYAVTTHAIDRAVERLGRNRQYASNDLVQRMQTAVFQGEVAQGRIYDHLPSRTRLILDKTEDKIITVYSMDTQKETEVTPKQTPYNAIIEKARVVIKRELTKARRQFTTEKRKLTLSEAELGVEIAQLTLNKARAKNPLTQASIQAKIDELENGRQALLTQLNTVVSRFEQMRKDAESYIGG